MATPPLTPRVFTDPWDAAWSIPWVEEIQVAESAEEIEIKAEVPAPLEAVYKRHGEWLDTIALRFEDELRPIVAEAAKRMGAWLRANLVIQHGVIATTSANLHILQTLDDRFMAFLDEAGYADLLARFTDQFGEQLPFLQETIDILAQESGHEIPAVSFTADQLEVMTALKLTTRASIRTAMEAAAGAAMQRVMFSIVGQTFDDLVQQFSEEFGGSLARNRQRAETAASVWYRSVQDTQYQKIETETHLDVRYVYAGPSDEKNRPFCRKMLKQTAAKALTREEIDKLDNGQIANVFVTCGGYGCRHQWLIDLRTRKPAGRAT